MAQNEDQLDAILDIPTNIQIVNNSSWSTIEPVTMSSRVRLLQQLIFEEVIVRREGNLLAFKKGLNSLQLGEIIAAHSLLMRPLFVAGAELPLTADVFLSLVKTPKPDASDKVRAAYDFFRSYVIYLAGVFTFSAIVSPISVRL